jgi:hypothetical protein
MLDRERLFEERIADSGKSLQGVLKFLQIVAENAGEGIDPPRTAAGGVGTSYKFGRRRVCQFDVRHSRGASHIFALVPGAALSALAEIGELSKQPGWVRIKNLRAAVKLVPLILESYRRIAR